MDVVAPSSVNYQDQLPLGIEAKSHRREFFPSTGDSYSDTTTNIIRIDLSYDGFLDTSQSYLTFDFINTSTKNMKLDLGQPVIKKLTVSSGGVVLEEIQNYNQLVGGVLIPSQAGTGNIHEQGLNGCIGAGGDTKPVTSGQYNQCSSDETAYDGSNATAILAGAAAGGATTTIKCCYKLVSGLLDNDKYIPLNLLNSGLQIEILLAPGNEIGVSTHSGPVNLKYDIKNVRYAAHLIDLSREFTDRLRAVQQASGGNLSIAGTSFRSFTGKFDANSSHQSINIPCRVRSIKSVFWKLSKDPSNILYNLSCGGHGNMSQYQLKIGAVNYPPTAVEVNTLTNKITPYLELQKAFGKLGSTVHSDLLGSGSYLTAETASLSANGGVFQFAPFGIDLESFRHQIENGIDSASRALPMSLELTTSGTNTAATTHIFVMYDSMFYVNIDGSMKVSS